MSENEMLAWPFQAMTFKTGSRNLLGTYEADAEVAFEQKLDGTRAPILLQHGEKPLVIQRNGAPLKHAASLIVLPRILDAMPEMPKGWRMIIDGELMWNDGTYVIFDLPSMNAPLMPSIVPSTRFSTRRDRLESLFGSLFSENPDIVKLVSHARTTEAKYLLAKNISDINGEGVLVKRLDAPYSVGTRVGHSLKVKFTKTVDVIVLAVEKGRNAEGNLSGSISFGLLPEPVAGFDATVGIAWKGSCSAIGREGVEPGMVIEVEYLAYMSSGGIREPRMTRIREDKHPSECTVAQFTEHSKAVL